MLPTGMRRRPVRSSAPRGANISGIAGFSVRQYVWITVGHWLAGLVHLVSFIVLLIVRKNASDYEGTLTSDTYVRNGTAVDVHLKTLKGYPLIDVLLPMPILTASFHFFQAILLTFAADTSLGKWYFNEIVEKRNLIRWIEYSITASLMTWIVCQLSGMTNIYLVWTVGVVMNVAMQIQGYMWELFQKQRARWIPFLTGSILFVGQWTLIICYFWRTINAADEEVPGFVHGIIWGLLGTFFLFPVAQVFVGMFFNWFWYEMAFIVLSAFSKLLLDWTLYGGIANQ